MRTFTLYFEGSARIELDEAVIEAVDDEWRDSFYDLYDASEIASHVGYNLIVNRIPLSHMDGWADQPDENARVVDLDLGAVAWEVNEVTWKPRMD